MAVYSADRMMAVHEVAVVMGWEMPPEGDIDQWWRERLTELAAMRMSVQSLRAERVGIIQENAAIVYRPPEVYHSIRSVERAPSERYLLSHDEREVGVSPGHNGKLIVWLVRERPAPEVPEADRALEGERAVTEEVSGV